MQQRQELRPANIDTTSRWRYLKTSAKSGMRCGHLNMTPPVSSQHRGDPAEQVFPDFAAVDLIEHFVPSTEVQFLGDVAQPRISWTSVLLAISALLFATLPRFSKREQVST
jgi:hypothetical protein